MPSLAESLSSYASSLSYDDLPGEVVHQAKRMIIDTLGCALGGYDALPSRIAREIAETVSSNQPATVVVGHGPTSVMWVSVAYVFGSWPFVASYPACVRLAGKDLR